MTMAPSTRVESMSARSSRSTVDARRIDAGDLLQIGEEAGAPGEHALGVQLADLAVEHWSWKVMIATRQPGWLSGMLLIASA